MSHPRPWEEFESEGIQFGEVAWHTTATAESKRRVDWQIESTPLHFANGEIPSHRDRQVVIEHQAWVTMRRHALEDPHHETGGLLLGYPFEWSEPTSNGESLQRRGNIDTGLWICRVLPGKHLDSTPTRLTFTYETWAAMECGTCVVTIAVGNCWLVSYASGLGRFFVGVGSVLVSPLLCRAKASCDRHRSPSRFGWLL